MAIIHTYPSGTTEPQTFQALVDGVATDFTGSTLAIEVTDRYGRTVTVTGTVAWVDASTGEWSYTPDGQLTEALSPYRVRLAITDGVGVVVKTPNGQAPDRWRITTP